MLRLNALKKTADGTSEKESLLISEMKILFQTPGGLSVNNQEILDALLLKQ